MISDSCAGCRHFWQYGDFADARACIYILDTGHRRPCPGGYGCTEYQPFKEGKNERKPKTTFGRKFAY